MAAPSSPNPLQGPSRVAALRRYDILDTSPEAQFDRFADLAAHVFDVPTAIISFIDADREWIKAGKNFDRQALPAEFAFGVHTITCDDQLVIENTKNDVRFVKHPPVTDPPALRFYAGAPLITPDDYRIGTIAVLDTEPQSPSPEKLIKIPS